MCVLAPTLGVRGLFQIHMGAFASCCVRRKEKRKTGALRVDEKAEAEIRAENVLLQRTESGSKAMGRVAGSYSLQKTLCLNCMGTWGLRP